MTLSLAGCGGGSSKTADTEPDPPEPTELENLQAAAKKAYDDANTAATGTAITTAVTGVLPLQTTGMEDGYHKAESLVQKDKAVAESVKAKEASDNAAKATTEATAKTAKDAAEAARTAAETARDAAVKAAMMDVKYAGDMYKVGDQSITPDALKQEIETTMEDGKVKTQTVGSRNIALRSSPIPSTVTPQTAAQNALVVGSYIDSQDDNVRLRLIDKYSDTDKANLFHNWFIEGTSTVDVFSTGNSGFGPVTEANPHGTWNRQPIKRAEGVFYQVTGLSENSRVVIAGATHGKIQFVELTATNVGDLNVPADAQRL